MVRPRGTPSTGKHRIEITRRLDKNSRQVTFSKRRAGLFKKCSELSLLCGALVAVIVFSEAGNLYALGSPSVDAVLRGYALLLAGAADDAWVDDDDDDDLDREALEEMFRIKEAIVEQVAAEIERMNSIGDKVIKEQGERPWWEADVVKALGEEELPEFFRALQRIRDNVRRYADKLRSAPPPAAAPAPAPVAHDGDGASNYWAC